jgi:DNA-binding CsgD family transcriptional regulator
MSRSIESSDLRIFGDIVARLEHFGPDISVRAAILGDIVKLVDADFAASYTWDAQMRRFTNSCAINMDPESLALYERQYQFTDPITLKLRARRAATPINAILPYHELYRTEFYNDFLRRDGLHHGVNMFVFDNQRDLGDFRIWRAHDRPEFGAREIDLLNAIEPFLRRSIIRTTYVFEALTDREKEVASLVARGCTDREIAAVLKISFSTVRTHLNRVLAKLACSNRAELAALIAANSH